MVKLSLDFEHAKLDHSFSTKTTENLLFNEISCHRMIHLFSSTNKTGLKDQIKCLINDFESFINFIFPPILY